MRALVHAELLKLRTTRAPGWLLLAMLAMVVLIVAVQVDEAGTKDAPVPLDDPGLLAVTVAGGFNASLLLMVLLAGLAVTQEFRYGTVTSTCLAEPRRARVLAAKWLALNVTSLVITTVTLVVAVPLAVVLIASRDGAVGFGPLFWEVMAGGFFVMAALATLGVAVGALVRNQVAAVVGVLVWMNVVERIVFPSYPTVGRWMPGPTTWAVMQMGAESDPDGKLLPLPASGLLLAAYIVVAVVLALRLTRKKDIR